MGDMYDNEVFMFLKDNDSAPLRYAVKKNTGSMNTGPMTNSSSMAACFTEMHQLVEKSLPITWGLLERVGFDTRRNIKKGGHRMIFNSLMVLLNCRNQKVNAFQTIVGVYLYVCHLQKIAIDNLHALGICSSSRHVNTVMKNVAEEERIGLKQAAKLNALKIDCDNVNRKVGVREGSSTHMSVMDHSTGGFVSPVIGMPPGMVSIPRSWLKETKRVELEPRELGPSAEALEVICQFRLHYMEKLLEREVGSGLRDQGDIGKFAKPVVEPLYHNKTPFWCLDLMDIEQFSVDGNLESIKGVLSKDIGFSNDDLMKALVLVGGDLLLVMRVRHIQMLREFDVAGEDFKYVVPTLGPLHTIMNYLKMIMRDHLGPKDGSRKGSLSHMNKRLRRDHIDEDVKNMWACMGVCNDVVDAALCALMVQVSGCSTWEEFREKSREGVYA